MERELNAMQEKVGCEAATVWMKESEILYPYVFFGNQTKGFRDVELKADQGLCGYCVTHNVEIISNNIAKDDRWYQAADQVTGFKTRNIICLPISVLNEVYGCVQLLNKKDGDFTEEDIEICRGMVSLIVEKL